MNRNQFKQNRLALGLTQEELAIKLELKGGQRYISAIENGRRNPSARVVRLFELLILTKGK